LRRFAQWPNDVQNTVSGFERIEEMGCLAERLHHNIDSATFRIGFLNGQRNALPVLANPDDDKLAWPLLARDPGRLNHEALNPWCDELGVDDFEHGTSLVLVPTIVPVWTAK